MLSLDAYTIASGATMIAVLLAVIQLFSSLMELIKTHAYTPLPEITTDIIVPKYQPIDQPYNPLSNIATYCDKYRDQYAQLKEINDDAEINAILNTLTNEHVQQLTDECSEINKLINEIRPFTTPSVGEFQTETPGETGIDIARKQLATYIATDDIWRNIHEKYSNSNINQIEALLMKFEETYYNKACEMLEDDEPDEDPELGDIYQDPDQDTTELTENTPPKPSHAEKVAEFMKNNVKYAYIQLYLYDLWIALLTAQIATIRLGTCAADYIDRAKEQYYRNKYQRLMHCILIEYTPLGNVYMYYNADSASFEYHSDKTVPFAILETVARKYVITYRCKELYVDIAAETIEMCDKDTIAYRKTHAFSGPKPLNEMAARAVVSERQNMMTAKTQKLMSKVPIRSWGESSSLRPDEPVLNKYKRRVNNFIKKGNCIQCKPIQSVDRKLTNRRLKMTFADWARERNAAKTAAKVIPGMSIPAGMHAVIGNDDSGDSATF